MALKTNRWTGLALIAGSITGFVTLGTHPLLSVVGANGMVRVGVIILVLLMLSLGLLMVGFLRLGRAHAGERPLVDAGVVAFSFTALAAAAAGLVGHVLIPLLMARSQTAETSDQSLWKIVISQNGALEVLLTQAAVGAWAATVIIWSAVLWQGGGARNNLSLAGVPLGGLVLAAVFVGNVGNVGPGTHLAFVGFNAWLLWLGVLVFRDRLHAQPA